MFRIHMLPAAHGDCLFVEYGAGNDVHRIVIDGGIARTYEILRERLLAIPRQDRRLALLVVTHVDADHIEGIVRMLSDDSLEIDIGEVWFNAYSHLAPEAPLHYGGVQGEYLSALIEKRKLPWNAFNQGEAIHVPEKGPLPVYDFPGGLRITLLSPTRETMDAMADRWEDEVTKAGLVPNQPARAIEHLETKGKRLLMRFGHDDEAPQIPELLEEPYEPDTAPANGSSIAFLAEYAGKRILFGADAFSEVLESSIERLLKERGLDVLEVDAFKLPHHGSSANLSPRLAKLVTTRRFLVSTSGKIFRHPDAEAIARVLDTHRDVEFVFNYKTPENQIWQHEGTQKEYRYRTVYPVHNGESVIVDIDGDA